MKGKRELGPHPGVRASSSAPTRGAFFEGIRAEAQRLQDRPFLLCWDWPSGLEHCEQRDNLMACLLAMAMADQSVSRGGVHICVYISVCKYMCECMWVCACVICV